MAGIDKVKALEEYERKIGKPGTEWGSKEVEGFFNYCRLQEVRQ